MMPFVHSRLCCPSALMEGRGGKRDVGSWTDSFFTHVRQVPSYCLGHKKTNAHKRGCFRSTVFLCQLLKGHCLVTQKALVWSFTFLVAYVCLHKLTQSQVCTQKWKMNLFWNEGHRGPLWGLLSGLPIIPHCEGRASGLLTEEKGEERNTETCCGKIKKIV